MINANRYRLPLTRLSVIRLALLFAALWLAVDLVGVAEASAQSLSQIRGRLERVRDERAAIEERMIVTQQRLEELHTRQYELELERDSLLRDIAEFDAELERLSLQVAHRIRETFKHGSSLDPVAVFLSSEDASGALSRAETIRWLVAGDRTRSDELAAARVRSAVAHEQLAERTAQLDATAEQFAELETELSDDFARLAATEAALSADERAELERLERERRERERRERERQEQLRREREAAERAAQADAPAPETDAAPTGSSGQTACPLDRPHSFIDSWGHPRSGGRRHRGTDMMAPNGIAVRAIVDGVWEHRRQGASAGIWGVLRGDNGDSYWYMHLSAHTVGNGARVTAGQQIGRNGSTGNASTPHLHFEHHPGGGGAVNPYGLLRRVCG